MSNDVLFDELCGYFDAELQEADRRRYFAIYDGSEEDARLACAYKSDCPVRRPGDTGERCIHKGLVNVKCDIFRYVMRIRDALEANKTEYFRVTFQQEIERYLTAIYQRYSSKGEYNLRIHEAMLKRELGFHLHKNGQEQEGRNQLMIAILLLGAYRGNEEQCRFQEFAASERGKRHLNNFAEEKARMGGQAKAEKNQVVKDKMAEILRAAMPAGGWKSKAAALKGGHDKLWAFVECYNEETRKINAKIKKNDQTRHLIDLKWDSFDDTLENWSREDENIRIVLEETVAPKKNR